MRKLNILAPTRYPWLFNGPRRSRHKIERRAFVPVNKVWPRYEAVTVFNPWPPVRFDMIHAFNRIPLESRPFVIGFESHLPRAYGLERTDYYRRVSRMLAGDRCRAIVAISQRAERTFRAQHSEIGLWPELERKLTVRLPNIEIPDIADPMDGLPAEPLVLTFVGGHFARKGGCVAVRLAQMAQERGAQMVVNVVSSLEVGAGVWTDPPRAGFFDRYVRLLNLGNVRYFKSLPNAEVQALLRSTHVSLLPTFSDTFGFSAIEAMANWAPVFATRTGALPEFIQDRINGRLFSLSLGDNGDWVHSGAPDRSGPAFERMFAEEIERLAEAAFSAATDLINHPARLAAMRAAARAEAERLFDADSASAFWDDLYDRSLIQTTIRTQ